MQLFIPYRHQRIHYRTDSKPQPTPQFHLLLSPFEPTLNYVSYPSYLPKHFAKAILTIRYNIYRPRARIPVHFVSMSTPSRYNSNKHLHQRQDNRQNN